MYLQWSYIGDTLALHSLCIDAVYVVVICDVQSSHVQYSTHLGIWAPSQYKRRFSGYGFPL